MQKTTSRTASSQSNFQINIPIDELAEKIVSKIRDQFSCFGSDQPIDQRLLSVKDAARYTGRTESALRHLIKAGKIPFQKFDRRIFIDKKLLDELIESASLVGLVDSE